MIFTSHIDEKGLTIKAHPENDAEWHGHRFDGDNPGIQLTGTEVTFEHPVKAVHPDLLGLLCMLLFFPFCKNKVTFPRPVSRAFQEAFSEGILPPHDKIDGIFKPSGKFEIQNVDMTLAKFSGSKLALAFGGGTDSMAAHILFPEAILTHELSRNPKGEIIPDNSVAYINEIKKKGGEAYSVVNNGRRCTTQPSGWTTWISSSATAVLLATDLDIGYILRGTNSDSLFLSLGYGFVDVPSPENIDPWFRAFNTIGLKHFSPVASMTEGGTMKICHDAGLLDKTCSCQKDQGKECHVCSKCLRKDSLAHALQFKSFEKHYWKRYKNEKVLKFLHKKPLLEGHIYKFSLERLPSMKWLKGFVDHIPDSSPFILPYYEPGILMAPEELQDEVRKRVTRYLKPLDEVEYLKNWSQPLELSGNDGKSVRPSLKAWAKDLFCRR